MQAFGHGRIPEMKEAVLIGVALTLLVSSFVSAYALEFTADQITKTDGRTHKANIYYRDDRWRIEHHSLSPVNVTIVRKDKQLVWLLLSRMRHFKTISYAADHDLKVTELLDGEFSREEIGKEIREGHPTIL